MSGPVSTLTGGRVSHLGM